MTVCLLWTPLRISLPLWTTLAYYYLIMNAMLRLTLPLSCVNTVSFSLHFLLTIVCFVWCVVEGKVRCKYGGKYYTTTHETTALHTTQNYVTDALENL